MLYTQVSRRVSTSGRLAHTYMVLYVDENIGNDTQSMSIYLRLSYENDKACSAVAHITASMPPDLPLLICVFIDIYPSQPWN